MTKNQDKKKEPLGRGTTMLERETPRWVKEATEYFQAHGHYRATDLKRVLGHPGASFSGRLSDDCSELANHKLPPKVVKAAR